MMKFKNNVKGITLIALVVTIIVLLILAGVAINLTIGNNGIFSKSLKAVKETEKAKAKEELAMAIGSMTIEYYDGNKDIFNKDDVINNVNQNLSSGKIEKAKVYYNEAMVDSGKIDELESIYKYEIDDEIVYFTISENGKIDYLQALDDFVQDYDENGISKQAGKWVSYPQQYSNQTKDYIMNAALNGWRILNNDGENTKIVTAGIPARYEYNHNKTIVDDWNDFSKFESTTFTWGMKDIKQLKQEDLAIGIRSINYNDIKEVTTSLSYIPSYTNSMWGSEAWPTRIQGLIGCENEYIVATWQNQQYDSLYYMTFQNDEYGMGLNSNGYLYYLGVRVVAYLNKNVHVYQSEYFDGSSYKRPFLLVY